MMYSISFSKAADKTKQKWQRSNPVKYKKLAAILHDIIDHPRTGMGHPEALVGGGDKTYSRRISAHDRIIYNIYDDRVEVLVIQIEDHYSDK